MFDQTINASEDFSPFTLVKEEVFFYLDKSATYNEFYLNSALHTIPPVEKLLDLRSDAKKIFLTMPTSVYHLFIDFAGKLLQEISIDPSIELVMDDHALRFPIPGNQLYVGLLDLFKKLGIKVTVVSLHEYDGIALNNVLLLSGNPIQRNYEQYLYKAALTLVRNKEVKPFRKVFLSRRHMGHRPAPPESPWLTVPNDNRIDDHAAIERYFLSLGYEIVIPDNFTSLEEQVNFFYETEILVSTTSSGITNAVFMQDGQTVVELQTPLVVHIPGVLSVATGDPAIDFSQKMVAVEQLHYFYVKVAFNKKHKYLSICNMTRATSDIVDQIERDAHLKALLQRTEPAPTSAPKKRKWLKR